MFGSWNATFAIEMPLLKGGCQWHLWHLRHGGRDGWLQHSTGHQWLLWAINVKFILGFWSVSYCCPCHSFIQGSLWMLRLLFFVWNEISSLCQKLGFSLWRALHGWSAVESLETPKNKFCHYLFVWGCSLNVFVFTIVFLLARSCLLITLIQCL